MVCIVGSLFLLFAVNEPMLETVMPKSGGKVMVVRGENRGRIGTLMEKTKDKGEPMAVVQLHGDFSVNNYNLDDVSQYVGHDTE
jgi:ribosomal protein S4E